MNKQQFMSVLKSQLKGINEKDTKELLYDYEEHFQIGLKEGRSEEEIANSLGNPKTIAKEIKANYMITQVEEKFTVGNFFRALLATLGLGFFNLVFVFGPFMGFASTLFALLVSGIAIAVSGVAILIGVILEPTFSEYINIPFHPIVAVFVSIFVTSLGVLWTWVMVLINKWFYMVTVKYLKLNFNIIANRREKNE